MKWIIALILVSIVFAAGCAQSNDVPLGCTEEAKLCPDGRTYVARNPDNNCEFDSCEEANAIHNCLTVRGTWDEDTKTCEYPTLQITPEQCGAAGGNWNECGSQCAGTGSDFCIEVCQAQCECGGIAGFGCPDGYTCRLSGTIEDEIGVCIRG